jgi:tRNA1Val (adenine37-N6)-methyltransferase
MERIDYVNDSLKLIQKTDGLTFGTDALLLAGYIGGKYKNALEIGGGTGIISMLLLSRGKAERAMAVEVQEEFSTLIERNAELNGLSDRLFAECKDIRDFRADAEFDLIYTNPPYMKADAGKSCEMDKKNIARHEVLGDIRDFALAAKRLLKFGGTFAVVYRPDRLTDLMAAMREAKLEPKRITFVHADTESESSMVLIETKAGGKSGSILTRPLIIYKDRSHSEYSEDMKYIMENGSFPKGYKR